MPKGKRKRKWQTAQQPAEVSVVRQKYGQAVATLYHTAFLARNGHDMCNDANYNWARCYFNRVANEIFKLQLHDLRHVWVAVSQAIASSVADRVHCAKTKQLLAAAAHAAAAAPSPAPAHAATICAAAVSAAADPVTDTGARLCCGPVAGGWRVEGLDGEWVEG
jgi:hypothetical protein